VAEISPPTVVEQVHPGGFFRSIERGDRLANLLEFAAQSQRLAVVGNTDRDVVDISERLRLSGVPIFEAVEGANTSVMQAFLADGAHTLVAHSAYVLRHGPIPITMAVHLRPAPSVREYAKRLEALPAAVHLTFVVPEDRARADSLQSHFQHDRGYGEPVVVAIEDLIDLTDGGKPATLVTQRRRFPLGR